MTNTRNPLAEILTRAKPATDSATTLPRSSGSSSRGQNMTFEEISKEMGIKTAAARYAYKTGLEKMKTILAKDQVLEFGDIFPDIQGCVKGFY